MASLRENAEALVASVTGLNSGIGTKQNIFTVPTGKSFIPTKAIIRNPSGNLSTGVAALGAGANADTWFATVNFTNVTGTGTAIEVKRVGVGGLTADEAEPADVESAGDVFGIMMGTTVAGTFDLDLFGYLV